MAICLTEMTECYQLTQFLHAFILLELKALASEYLFHPHGHLDSML